VRPDIIPNNAVFFGKEVKLSVPHAPVEKTTVYHYYRRAVAFLLIIQPGISKFDITRLQGFTTPGRLFRASQNGKESGNQKQAFHEPLLTAGW
jgi:hypothetical protein